MEHQTISKVEQSFYLDHPYCGGLVSGAFAITLDRYQLDELERNGYTVVTETCHYCYRDATFLLHRST